MLVPKYYEDLEIMHENTMPYRAYYIPASCNKMCIRDRNTGILRLRILSSGVQWIISEQFRGSRFVLMQRSVMQILSHCRISMNIKWNL